MTSTYIMAYPGSDAQEHLLATVRGRGQQNEGKTPEEMAGCGGESPAEERTKERRCLEQREVETRDPNGRPYN